MAEITELGVKAIRDGVAAGDFTAREVAEAFNANVAAALMTWVAGLAGPADRVQDVETGEWRLAVPHRVLDAAGLSGLTLLSLDDVPPRRACWTTGGRAARAGVNAPLHIS